MIVRYILLDSVQYSDVKEYADLLPIERQQKISRYRYESDKLLSLIAGLLIRREIGDGQLVFNEHGKPYAADGSLFFSVSHSGSCAAIAVDSGEIGADVERLTQKDHMDIARRFFHPNELSCVEGSDDPARAFTRVWTRKEAYLKQLGIGISTDLSGFDTVSGEIAERIASFDLDCYVLSVCSTQRIDSEEIYISKLELKDIIKA